MARGVTGADRELEQLWARVDWTSCGIRCDGVDVEVDRLPEWLYEHAYCRRFGVSGDEREETVGRTPTWTEDVARRSSPVHPAPGGFAAYVFSRHGSIDSASCARFYAHVRPAAIDAFVADAVSMLDRWRIPFQLKAPTSARAPVRRDGVVIYVDRAAAPCTAEVLSDLAVRHRTGMKDGVPLFALELAAGLGFAEDPGDRHSFGQQRVALLAESLLAMREDGVDPRAEGADYLRHAFERHGLSDEAPHRAAGSNHRYPFEERTR